MGIVVRLLREAGYQVEADPANVRFFLKLSEKLTHSVATRLFRSGNIGEVLAGAALEASVLPDASAKLDSKRLCRLKQLGLDENLAQRLFCEFLEFTAGTLDLLEENAPTVCGFSLSIDQTTASLVWAREIKRKFPHIAIVFGGSQCSHPMGRALLEAAHFVDAVGLGECDGSIVAAFDALLNKRIDAALPNFAWRSGNQILQGPLTSEDAGKAVTPDYREFQSEYAQVYELTGEPANFYIEASRGCWWGQKHHCTFCGIHARELTFRAKPVSVVVEEVCQILRTCGTVQVAFSDTILAREHLKDLLPRLEALRDSYDVEFLGDLKPNLKREEIVRLARAGFTTVQIGVESLSTRLLGLMKKGNQALQQIQTIRWLTEAGSAAFITF